MSQEDLKEFIEFEKKSKLIKIKLNEILSICNESEDFYSIKNLCKNQIDEINSNIEATFIAVDKRLYSFLKISKAR